MSRLRAAYLRSVCPRSIKFSLPFSLPWRHARDKLSQALSRFSVLLATKSWAGPGNEARSVTLFLILKKIGLWQTIFLAYTCTPAYDMHTHTCIRTNNYQHVHMNAYTYTLQEAYKQWLCATRLTLHMMSDTNSTNSTQLKPCIGVCHKVLQRCPYYLPSKFQPPSGPQGALI